MKRLLCMVLLFLSATVCCGQDNKESVKEFEVKGVRFKMVLVKGGTFTMGATSEQGSTVDADESPTHKVTLSDYYIGETEVTQALWCAVTGEEPKADGGWTNKCGRGNDYPAYQVSYDEVVIFIRELGRLTNCDFRLPTEAEWEYAARGGSRAEGATFAGSDYLKKVGWCKSNSDMTSHPVKSREPNALGLYDMSGNVYEWCNDWYGGYSADEQKDPKGDSEGTDRVIRGGCWREQDVYCRVSNRGSARPSIRNDVVGFRLAMSPPPTSEIKVYVTTTTVNTVSRYKGKVYR